MRLKKSKSNKSEVLTVRCEYSIKNEIKRKANIYTEGNISEFLIYAALNFISSKEDFEDEQDEN